MMNALAGWDFMVIFMVIFAWPTGGLFDGFGLQCSIMSRFLLGIHDALSHDTSYWESVMPYHLFDGFGL